MSNRQARREQSRQARRQATSYRGGRSRGSSRGQGSGGGGPNFLSWPFLAGVSLLAAGLLAVVVVLAMRNGGDGDAQSLSVIDQAFADLPVEMQMGNKLGSDDAPVKMIQYEDFQCPHCLRYTRDHEGFLVEEFVKSGQLQIEFRHFPVVGQESTTAAIGAVCAAEQDRAFEYANRLFAEQAGDGFRPDQGAYSKESLLAIAGDLGLDTDAFAACQDSPDSVSLIAGDETAARAIGFRGTPNFVVNGVPVQNPPQTNERWRELIEDAFETATASVLDKALAALPVGMQTGNKLGNDDAPAKMILYEDFQCPHCLRFTEDHEGFLVEEFVKSGQLQIEFRHFPVVGQESTTAAIGAVCAAEQDRAFEYANRLFAEQAEEGFRPDDGAFSKENLLAIAGDLGLDTDAFATCQDSADAVSRVADDETAARDSGFRGTPSFVINGAPLQEPPQTNEGWREVIEDAIAAATAEDEPDSGDEPDAEDATGAEGDDTR